MAALLPRATDISFRWIVLGSGAIVVAALALAFLTGGYPVLWLAILALGVFAAAPFIYELRYRSDNPDPFAPIFWVAPVIFLWYGGQTAIRLVNGNFEMYGNYTGSVHPSRTMLLVIIFAIIALSCIYIGYYRSIGSRLADRVPSFNSGWSSSRAWIAIAILMVVGIAGYLSLRSAIGTGPRSQLAGGSTTIGFIAVNLLNTASILVVAEGLLALQSGPSRRFRADPRGWMNTRLQPYQRVLPKLALGAVLVFVNMRILWTLGGRGRAFGILIFAAFLFHYLFLRMPFSLGMAAFVIVEVFPGWMADIVINTLTLDPAGLVSTIASPRLFLESDFSRLNNITILVAGVPETVAFQWGQTFASAFFQLAPIHPFPETQYVYNDAFLPRFGETAGVPITLLGELYLNFWLPGIVIGMLIVGVVMRAVYSWLITNGFNPASAVLFATLGNAYLLGGNFSNALPSTGLKLLPMFLVLLFVTGLPPISSLKSARDAVD